MNAKIVQTDVLGLYDLVFEDGRVLADLTVGQVRDVAVKESLTVTSGGPEGTPEEQT